MYTVNDNHINHFVHLYVFSSAIHLTSCGNWKLNVALLFGWILLTHHSNPHRDMMCHYSSKGYDITCEWILHVHHHLWVFITQEFSFNGMTFLQGCEHFKAWFMHVHIIIRGIENCSSAPTGIHLELELVFRDFVLYILWLKKQQLVSTVLCLLWPFKCCWFAKIC